MSVRPIFTFILTIALVFTFIGCKELFNNEEPAPPTTNFDSPENMMENPNVSEVIEETGFPVELSSSPPDIEGTYGMSGSVVDASNSSMVGTPMASEIEFYNQNGIFIDMKETASGQTAYGTGNFIRGQDDIFTVYQEAQQDISGYTITVVALMSGTLQYNGDIDAESLSIITDVGGYPGGTTGVWWQGDVTLSLESGKRSVYGASIFEEPAENTMKIFGYDLSNYLNQFLSH